MLNLRDQLCSAFIPLIRPVVVVSDLLPLSISGVKLTDSGKVWVDSKLMNEMIWFRLIESPPNTTTIPAIVLQTTAVILLFTF